MTHSDNKGLVLPPKVAMYQVVIVPISFKETDSDKLMQTGKQLNRELNKRDIRSHIDTRDNYTPGWKYNHWEMKGVPIRLELGPKEIEKGEITAAFRYNGKKTKLQMDGLVE